MMGSNSRKKRDKNVPSENNSPKIGTGVNNPMSSICLSYSFLHKSFFRTKKFHCQFIISRLKEVLELIAEEGGLVLARRGVSTRPVQVRHAGRERLVLRCPVQTHVVP